MCLVIPSFSRFRPHYLDDPTVGSRIGGTAQYNTLDLLYRRNYYRQITFT